MLIQSDESLNKARQLSAFGCRTRFARRCGQRYVLTLNEYEFQKGEATMKWTMGFCLALFSCLVLAEPEPWMKQADPNSLGLYVSVSGSCPFAKEELTNRIEGEFLRSRIKPTKSTSFNLTINVHCMSVKNKGGTVLGNVASYEIRYGAKMASGAHVLYEGPNHGSMIVGSDDSESTQYFIKSITDGVSLSLTDYLKANFQ